MGDPKDPPFYLTRAQLLRLLVDSIALADEYVEQHEKDRGTASALAAGECLEALDLEREMVKAGEPGVAFRLQLPPPVLTVADVRTLLREELRAAAKPAADDRPEIGPYS